jgi:spore maturation protein CgeB
VSRPFHGLRVLLVAAFNARYHRSGRDLARGLETLGCEVRTCEARDRGWPALFGPPLPERLATALRRGTDVVLAFRGDRLEPALVAHLRPGTRARWVNWFPDDPHDAALGDRLAPAYDLFFTHDSASLSRYRRAGVQAHYLAFGVDPAYVCPVASSARWRAAMVFVGSRDPLRERVLDAVADLGLLVWGPRWPNGPVYGRNYVHALGGGALGLNVHQQFGSDDPARYGSGANMRVFELAAVGTPQLVDAKADIARHFTPEHEIVLYRSVADLRARASALLAHEAERASLAAAARVRVLRDHTWAHRLEELLTITLR